MWRVDLARSGAERNECSAYFNDLISEMYDRSWYGNLRAGELKYYCVLMRDVRALEFPVGTGRLAIPLLKAGIDVYGFDNSSEMLAQLSSKLAAASLTSERHRFIEWGALNVPYPCGENSCEVAVIGFGSFSLMHSNVSYPIEENRVLRELNRIVTNGGTIVVNDYRCVPIDRAKLDEPRVFNHRHQHPLHGELLEEQIAHLKVEPNRLINDQVVRYRQNRLVRVSDGYVLKESTEVTPIWDAEGFRVLGEDAGFEYMRGEVVDFYVDRTINHVFAKRRDISPRPCDA